MNNVIVLARAGDDLQQARVFYDTQEPGLGAQCVTSVLADLANLAHVSGIHSRRHGYYRMIEKTFHLGIYYRQHGEDTLIVAILDLRRDPKWIRTHLRKRPNE